MVLDTIHKIRDLKKLSIEELETLGDEVRERIIDVVSRNGGHLSSSLGVVELTVALHYVFNTPTDKLIWDVGHQSYAHKILTGRAERFSTIRTLGGISGFPKMSESPFDSFNTGHSSTSLSLALGEAVARDLKREKHSVIAVIGDGSLTGGMAFEALNQIGHLKKDIIIVLNDNEHSISKNVGAISEYLLRIITGGLYNRLRRRSYDIIRKIPRFGDGLYDFIYKQEARLKGLFVPGLIFEEMGLRYFGPIDGHNTGLLIEIFEGIKNIKNGPKIVHVITKKGRGFAPAEHHPAKFHGVGPFERSTGLSIKPASLSYSEIAGRTLAELSRTDKKILAITAAMKLGTGLYEFEKRAPSRFFDVGIAEQHAVTFSAALAARGFKPFVSIYSTFLQRAIDQLIHDVATMNLPVRLLVDRAGIVGEDGETHHGLFDIGIIKNIPNFMFLAPSSGMELRDMIHFAAAYDKGPIAIRYARGGEAAGEMDFASHERFTPSKIKRLTKGKDIAVFAVGDMVQPALRLAAILAESGYKAGVVNLLSIKPLDLRGIERVILESGGFITMENGYLSGGIGEYLLSRIRPELREKFLWSAGFPDEFIGQGKNRELFALHGMDPESLAKRLAPALARTRYNEKRDTIRRVSG
ncbi:MAG: 1-deoxy-D-xylulose-5-phosphate synthase [Spirochaetes bacterium]|nr:MAG: 1-deoxy-D-xylulose-5-phosphate synthase [Spirochaetota bacterium]